MRLAVAFGAILAAGVGCAIGAEQEPGCHVDADCGAAWTCRAGACFATTTSPSSTIVDGGDGGDGAEAMDAGGE